MVLPVAWWSVLPFAAMLLAIAILPIVAGRFWHSNQHRLDVAVLLSLPVVAYLQTFDHGTELLLHALLEYAEFIILIGSLYTIAGGIAIEGQLRPTPTTNALVMLLGAVLANLIGTTGASMLLIRPLLRMNALRRHNAHVPVFFIFAVGNLGGLLTPLGDPPLYLGFLQGVDFFWTLALWRHWLVANLCVLAAFWVWDALAFRREDASAFAQIQPTPLRLEGGLNFLWLAGIVVAALLQSERIAGPLHLPKPWGAIAVLVMARLSLATTPQRIREINQFNWEPVIEVAVLFLGIFLTMVPALELLKGHGAELGLRQPWQYFWLTGTLSAFLDNAPTYLAFATLAAAPGNLAQLMIDKPLILQAISAGAVFLGAMTYIGNGPNFMIKAIAENAGYRMPSFFGYMAYSIGVLVPIFALVTMLFFRGG